MHSHLHHHPVSTTFIVWKLCTQFAAINKKGGWLLTHFASINFIRKMCKKSSKTNFNMSNWIVLVVLMHAKEGKRYVVHTTRTAGSKNRSTIFKSTLLHCNCASSPPFSHFVYTVRECLSFFSVEISLHFQGKDFEWFCATKPVWSDKTSDEYLFPSGFNWPALFFLCPFLTW